MGKSATAVTGFLEHTLVNVIFAFAILIAMKIYGNMTLVSMVFWGMIFSTIFMSCDIDSERSIVYRNWWIFRYLWLPYAKIIPHSGNDLNIIVNTRRGIGHNIILGTAIRLCYLFILVSIIMIIIGFGVNDILAFLKENRTEIGKFCLGVWLADIAHISVDAIMHLNRG